MVVTTIQPAARNASSQAAARSGQFNDDQLCNAYAYHFRVYSFSFAAVRLYYYSRANGKV
jgi:hypothetical protein